MNIRQVIRSNTYLTGVIIGLICPVICTLILIPVFRLIFHLSGNSSFVSEAGILLLGLIPNVLIFRFFMKKADESKTGKGLFAVTAVLILLYFFFIHNHPFSLPV